MSGRRDGTRIVIVRVRTCLFSASAPGVDAVGCSSGQARLPESVRLWAFTVKLATPLRHVKPLTVLVHVMPW